MTVSFELDQTKFQEAAAYVFEQSHRTMPDIINRAALVTLIGGSSVEGAMQRTPKAAAEAIRGVPIKAVAAYVKQRHAEKLSPQQFAQLIKKEYARRIASIAYTAKVGWNKAVIALGGRGISAGRVTGKGYASFGTGVAATTSNYTAEFTNATPAAALIGEQPLQDALDAAARDMVEFWDGKAEEIFGEASGGE